MTLFEWGIVLGLIVLGTGLGLYALAIATRGDDRSILVIDDSGDDDVERIRAQLRDQGFPVPPIVSVSPHARFRRLAG